MGRDVCKSWKLCWNVVKHWRIRKLPMFVNIIFLGFLECQVFSSQSLYIAEQTSVTNRQIADFDIRNWNCKLEYDSPVAKYLKVQASFSATGNGLRMRVDCFSRTGVPMAKWSKVAVFMRKKRRNFQHLPAAFPALGCCTRPFLLFLPATFVPMRIFFSVFSSSMSTLTQSLWTPELSLDNRPSFSHKIQPRMIFPIFHIHGVRQN